MSEYNRPPARVAGAMDASRFAPADRGVTGGDGHDHRDGRGGAISWSAIDGVPAAFPPSPHGHGLDDVAGLRSSLDGKEPAIGAKGAAFNKGFGTAAGCVCEGNDSRLSDARLPLAHGHAVAEVAGLSSALDAKAGIGHGHAVADVTGLQSSLDGKAALAHSHDAAYAAIGHVGGGGAAHALATAGAAGFLSSYEEGAWTPILAGDAAAGSNAYDAAATGGQYVRVGRLVFVHGRVKATAVSGMAGWLLVKGLPFALASVGGQGHAIAAAAINGLNGVPAGSLPMAMFANGSSTAYLQLQSAAGLSLIPVSNCVAGSEVYISGSYIKG